MKVLQCKDWLAFGLSWIILMQDYVIDGCSMPFSFQSMLTTMNCPTETISCTVNNKCTLQHVWTMEDIGSDSVLKIQNVPIQYVDSVPYQARRVEFIGNQITEIGDLSLNWKNANTDKLKLLELYFQAQGTINIQSTVLPPELRSLTLFDCGITTLNGKKDFFPSSLEIIELGKNKLSTIPQTINWPKGLQYLGLSNNQFQSMPFPIPPVQSLQLQNNVITTVQNITFPTTLQSLNLSNNKIQIIDNVIFPTNLKRLDLSGNTIQVFTITSTTYKVLQQLSYLAISSLNVSSINCINGILQPLLTYKVCVLNHPPASTTPEYTKFSTLPNNTDTNDNSNANVPTSATQVNSTTFRSPTLYYLVLIPVGIVSTIIFCSVLMFLYRRYTRANTEDMYNMTCKSATNQGHTNPNFSCQNNTTNTRPVSIILFNDIRYNPSLSHYRLPRSDVLECLVLSETGIGITYYGKFEHQQVAIKQLNPLYTQNVFAMQIFMEQARACSQLKHPHIATFIGFTWSHASNVCIVSEYMAHGDLMQLIKQGHTLALKQFTWFTSNTNNGNNNRHTNASDSNHSTNVDANNCNGDIYNPEIRRTTATSTTSTTTTSTSSIGTNSILNVSKHAIAMSIIDALQYGQEHFKRQSFACILKTNQVLFNANWQIKLNNTCFRESSHPPMYSDMDESIYGDDCVSYIAPELFHGSATSFKTEIYALGIVLCEMDSCFEVYTDQNGNKFYRDDIMHGVARGTLQPTISSSCPLPIRALVTQCLAYRPTDRPSIAELSEALKQLTS